MSYVYSVMWLVIGIYLCFFMGRENKLIMFLSFYFFFSAAWWFTDAVTPLELFVAPYTWVFRAISAVTFVIAAAGYVRQKKRLSAQTAESAKAVGEKQEESGEEQDKE